MILRLLALAALLVAPCSACAGAPPDPYAVAARLDRAIDGPLQLNAIKPAGPIDDAKFLRRASLDIAGRIPTTEEVRSFLADRRPDKRRQLIQALLKGPDYVNNSVNFWRALLLPEAAANADMRGLQAGFDAWLRTAFRENKRYDKFVYELVAAPLGTIPEQPAAANEVRPNPLAFFTAKDGKPENLAAAVSRTFLGVQIECAQCHDHPFAKWGRDHFWGMAAFFGGIERKGDGAFDPAAREIVDRRELIIPNTERVVQATFLDEHQPEWKFKTSPRVTLAKWMISPGNKWFARALVNRLWAHYFGYGIVDPIDDFNDKNAPSHPALLDDLAQAFIASGYDLHFVVTAITATQAYQRDSAITDPSQLAPRTFASMPVKGLTGEQLFDSLALATGYRPPNEANLDVEAPATPARRDFLEKFALPGRKVSPQTSILQALSLMNGRLVANATDIKKGATLAIIAKAPNLALPERIECLYFATLSRKPTDAELCRVLRHIGGDEKEKLQQGLSDVLWVLLNSAEFRLNH
jgi:hypothetical protein